MLATWGELKGVYLSFPPLLFTSLLFTAICKASVDSHFAFFAFLFLGDALDPCLLYNVTTASVTKTTSEILNFLP